MALDTSSRRGTGSSGQLLVMAVAAIAALGIVANQMGDNSGGAPQTTVTKGPATAEVWASWRANLPQGQQDEIVIQVSVGTAKLPRPRPPLITDLTHDADGRVTWRQDLPGYKPGTPVSIEVSFPEGARGVVKVGVRIQGRSAPCAGPWPNWNQLEHAWCHYDGKPF